MRRIVAFFQHMPPYSGAAALRGKSIIESLCTLSPDSIITVYCSNGNADPIGGAVLTTLNVPEVENSLSLTRRFIGEIRMGLAASRCMFIKRDRPDLAIISSPGYIAALVQTFFAKLRGIPYVLEMRDIYPQVYLEASLIKRNSLTFKIFSWLSRKMYRDASLVICATQGLVREVLDQEPRSKVQDIYNGFPAQLATRKADKHHRFSVCFHGILGFFQDVDTLLKVTEKLALHNIDVIVIGYGRKEEPLEKSELNNLRFLGRKSFDETISEVERCHLGLCLRLDDGISKDAFPVKVWEYIGLGIPTVITPPCEAGDFLQQHKCGFVLESGDIDGIVNIIIKIKTDLIVLECFSANCRRVAKDYTREKTGQIAAQAILNLVNDSNPNCNTF